MPQKFIADRLEATLCVGWYLLFIAGFILGSFVTPYGWILVALAPVDVALLLLRVARRFGPGDRRFLRLWLTTNAQYQAWRFLFGKSAG